MLQIEHVNLVVKDIPATLDFITTAFPDWMVRGQGNGTLYGYESRWLHVGTDKQYLTLNAAEEVSAKLGNTYQALSHIGLNVENVDEVSKRLLEKGYEISAIGPDHPARQTVYFLDPTGIEFEFLQYKTDDIEKRNQYGGETSEVTRMKVKHFSSDRSAYIAQLYQAVDNRDVDSLGTFLAEDIVFRLGNFDSVIGFDAVIEANKSFFASIKQMAHTIEDVWSQGDDVICHGRVDYVRLDDTETSATFSTVLKLKDEKIVNYLVFVDLSQL